MKKPFFRQRVRLGKTCHSKSAEYKISNIVSTIANERPTTRDEQATPVSNTAPYIYRAFTLTRTPPNPNRRFRNVYDARLEIVTLTFPKIFRPANNRPKYCRVHEYRTSSSPRRKYRNMFTSSSYIILNRTRNDSRKRTCWSSGSSSVRYYATRALSLRRR